MTEPKKGKAVKRRLRILAYIAGGSLLLCLVAAGVAILSNRNLPTAPVETDRLSPLDKARLEEALRLKRALGGDVWPGWAHAEIPVLVWNSDHSFLVDYVDPPAPWAPVPDDAFREQVYYRRTTGDHQNFAVQVGDRWVASMATKWETDAFMIGMIRDTIPPPLNAVVPYRLVVQPSEVQMTGILHETFHVYQAQVAPRRLDEAELVHRHGDPYWRADEAMRDAWEQETDLLVSALRAGSDEEARELARQFLDQRSRRRAEAVLDDELVEYERQLEWEEGLAKYVELAIWRAAYEAEDDEPLPGMVDDPDFRRYRSFERRWSQEIGQLVRQATREGDVRFYVSSQ